MKNKHEGEEMMMKKKAKHEDADVQKMVYLSISDDNYCTTFSWLKIDSSLSFDPVSPMVIPESLELHKLYGYACVSSGSKVYFISGKYHPGYFSTSTSTFGGQFTNKVFTYDINSQTWDHHHDLNVRRAFPVASVFVPHLDRIYVFGGEMRACDSDRETWIEWYDLRDENTTWQFLFNDQSYPPQELYDAHPNSLMWYALDVRRNRVLIHLNDRYQFEQLYAFDYLVNAWCHLPLKLGSACIQLSYDTQLTIQQDLLIWQSFGTIWGYDLITNMIVLQYSFEHMSSRFSSLQPFGYYPQHVYVMRVANNKLLLLWGDIYDEDEDDKCNMKYEISCRQFIIKDISSPALQNAKSPFVQCLGVKTCLRYELVLNDCKSHTMQGFAIDTCLLV